MTFFTHHESQMVSAENALPGRAEPLPTPDTHFVNGHSIKPPFPDGFGRIVVGMGCFWGAEKELWETPGVYTTAVGYAGGYTPNPTYEEVCTGRTGHAEVVLVVWDPSITSLEALLTQFWENHDPTQGMRQGNDIGTQYRSAVFTSDDAQLEVVQRSREVFQARLSQKGYGEIRTQIAAAGPWYYAEGYHQQYLAKNPGGYCPVHATGVSCPVRLLQAGVAPDQ